MDGMKGEIGDDDDGDGEDAGKKLIMVEMMNDDGDGGEDDARDPNLLPMHCNESLY